MKFYRMMSPEDYMLPCINKKIFGLDCMGCGMQRSLALILEGDLIAAFYMYPAIYSLMALLGVILLNYFRNFKHAYKIIITLAIVNAVLILGNFIYKTFLN
ncbi:DUF2752 domain-containing protein [Psychroserpens luteolus]|uniref:DUF2752 domain-containing protein n=1 Tax=Psychroserpens luteolus TaxID=2855840 RepID=UPI001E28CB2C|nr:DUF2752 domain-containing protein [Psychroserpens luteolus]MCD2259370.1 DUF2752 domain-containing protein [Psychroserpens luteolus]